jgi:hypothetical protein
MLRATYRPLCALLLALAAGCHGMSVDSTHADDVDFTQLRTYDWLTLPATSPTAARDETVVGVLGTTLEQKGLRRVTENPDLLVAVHRTIEGSLNTQSDGYEFRDGRLRRYTLQQGQLVVDLVLAKTKDTVWRGVAGGAFRADLAPEQRRAMLEELIAEMFADYPPR